MPLFRYKAHILPIRPASWPSGTYIPASCNSPRKLPSNDDHILSVKVLNPLEFKNLPTDKQFVLDLKVMLNDNRILNFEVQVIDEKDWLERSLTYACRTFDQLQIMNYIVTNLFFLW